MSRLPAAALSFADARLPPAFAFSTSTALAMVAVGRSSRADQLLKSRHDRRIAVELGDHQQQLMIELAGIFERLGERFQGDLLGREILVAGDIDGDQAGETHVGVVGGQQLRDRFFVGVLGEMPGGFVAQMRIAQRRRFAVHR